MNHKFFLFLSFFLFLALGLHAQVPVDTLGPQKQRVDIEHADVFELIQGRNQMTQKLLGDVELSQDSIYMYCDSAIIENRRERINEVLAPITEMSDTFVPVPGGTQFGFQGARHLLLNQAEGQLNTGRLMRSLMQRAQDMGIEWQGGISITAWTETAGGVTLSTAQGWALTVSRVLLATNGFAQQLLPDWEVLPARNQVLITKPLAKLPFRGCFHYDRGYYYFRDVGQRILLGGGRHLDKIGETTTELAAHPTIRAALLHLLQTVILPEQAVEVDRWWSGIMGVGQQKTPLISAVSERVVAAVRLGGMGVALGTWVGESGAELILGESSS